MSPEVNSSSPSPNIIANSAFLELTSISAPSSAPIGNSCSNATHLSHGFNSFSHHAPVHGQFSSPPLITGKTSHIAHASIIPVSPPVLCFWYYKTNQWVDLMTVSGRDVASSMLPGYPPHIPSAAQTGFTSSTITGMVAGEPALWIPMCCLLRQGSLFFLNNTIIQATISVLMRMGYGSGISLWSEWGITRGPVLENNIGI